MKTKLEKVNTGIQCTCFSVHALVNAPVFIIGKDIMVSDLTN